MDQRAEGNLRQDRRRQDAEDAVHVAGEFQHKGVGHLLVQTFTGYAEHSYLGEPEYPALFTALLQWVDKGEKPTPASVLALCKGYEAGFGAGCRIQPGYQPPAIDARVTPRPR